MRTNSNSLQQKTSSLKIYLKAKNQWGGGISKWKMDKSHESQVFLNIEYVLENTSRVLRPDVSGCCNWSYTLGHSFLPMLEPWESPSALVNISSKAALSSAFRVMGGTLWRDTVCNRLSLWWVMRLPFHTLLPTNTQIMHWSSKKWKGKSNGKLPNNRKCVHCKADRNREYDH